MKRKVALSISAILILLDIAIAAAMYDAGERKFGTTFEAVAALIRNYLRPLPGLGD